MPIHPIHLDLKRDEALTVRWSDGRESVYPIAYLRRMSPSADAQQTREEIAKNPLAVLSSTGDGPLRAERIEPVGRYAVRLVFSDGHHTGLYTWAYLREIDPGSGPNVPDNTTPDSH
jgi:DUF971 family protein